MGISKLLSAQSMYMDLGRLSFHLMSVRTYVRSFVRARSDRMEISGEHSTLCDTHNPRLTVGYCL